MAKQKQSSDFPGFKIYTDLIVPNHKSIPHIFIPGNVPSQKNNQKIIQVPMKTSACCNAPILEGYEGKHKVLTCSQCRRIARRNHYPKIMHGDHVTKYIKDTELIYNSARMKALLNFWTAGLDNPKFIGMYFLRAIDNEWDFNNATHVILDLFKTYGHIPTDSTRDIIPVFLGYHKNDTNPGVVLMFIRDPWIQIKQMLLATYDYYQKNNLTAGPNNQ